MRGVSGRLILCAVLVFALVHMAGCGTVLPTKPEAGEMIKKYLQAKKHTFVQDPATGLAWNNDKDPKVQQLVLFDGLSTKGPLNKDARDAEVPAVSKELLALARQCVFGKSTLQQYEEAQLMVITAENLNGSYGGPAVGWKVGACVQFAEKGKPHIKVVDNSVIITLSRFTTLEVVRIGEPRSGEVEVFFSTKFEFSPFGDLYYGKGTKPTDLTGKAILKLEGNVWNVLAVGGS